jgi:hypothetical protein
MHVDMGRLGRYRIWGQFRVFDAVITAPPAVDAS